MLPAIERAFAAAEVITLSKPKVLICSGWPYASNVPHLGNLIGCLLSGDALARYYRLKGCDVLHVSGSDTHGTNIEFEAFKRGVSPKELSDRVHQQILEIIKAFEIDMYYTTTESPTHYRFVHDLYKKAEANGYITSLEEEQAYCTHDGKFLADRFIQGTCPHCGSPNAYGNQCDDCGTLLEPSELKNPRCRICGQSTISFRKTRNWYLDLPKLEPQLKAFIAAKGFQDNVGKFTENLLKEGLKPRAVTRDLEWGIPAPFQGAEGKVIYVWAEAALGYVSATMEYFEKQSNPRGWEPFWLDEGKSVKHVYTQGKDNIPFHTIFFPAQLLSSGTRYHLPDQISATEYLNWIGGQKFSKTRGIGVYSDEALKLLPGSYWRFYLLLLRPEQRDIDFSWEDLDKAINGVLANNIANLIHRVTSLAHRSYGGIISPTAIASPVSKAIEGTKAKYQQAFEAGSIAQALRHVADLAVVGNEYVQKERPWEGQKPEVIANAYALAKALAILLSPFVPSFSERVYRVLSLNAPTLDDVGRLEQREIRLGPPERLLEKIDIEEVRAAYDQMKGDKKP
ncbi:MAG: methionine--tRNA ligase [Candidatus Fraserbacteria bacterium RBG_16_55_9]|uniref:Methionine--tRNA ligase n=1 Tax=Fraserbacteria sp. (strain RBG_16_55_9) TaxID=1817864 RepID=A0A1F5UWU6_FRAXR|nr:MAG: methionine--tRNA ligase [Candidatus Fraserbacteria bacterium RBG_16_55_9]